MFVYDDEEICPPFPGKFDEEAEAKVQGLPCILVPKPLSREEWEKKYCPNEPEASP
jgi:hypothetical protein